MGFKLLTGLEIEAVLNRDFHKFPIGSYHNGLKISEKWETQRDGSLNHYSEFKLPFCVEFVSSILKDKKGFFEALKEFKDLLSKNGKYELNEVLSFNNSCGCHIHIGLNNSLKFRTLTEFRILKEMRDLFFKKIELSKVLNKKTKQDILTHYFRGFAQELRERQYLSRRSYNRSSEFNTISEEINKGLEWRSFNLLNVKKWIEFEEVFKIGFECINFLFKKRKNGYISHKKPLRIQKAILKRDLKEEEVLNIEDLNEEYFLNV